MNNWIVRGLLLGLLLCSVAIKATSGSDAGESVTINQAVLHLMASRGFSFRETIDTDGELLKGMVFDTPTCGRPLQIAPTYHNYQAKTLFDHIGAAGDARIFAYLGLVSREKDSLGMFLEHVKQHALKLVGLTAYQIDGVMVMITEPAGCDIATRIDWTMLWKKDFRSRVASDRAALRQQNEPVTP
jgi:hypothetical protein